jgi:signal transduction histidine kinase
VPDPAEEVELALRRRLAELAGINAIGIVLASVRDPDQLVVRGLDEIVGRLGFTHGLIALVDPAGDTIGSCRLAGPAASIGPETIREVEAIQVDADDPVAALARLARAEGPLHFRDADRDPDERNRRLAAILDATGFVGTPLTSQGRVVGVLVVDDRRNGRVLEPADGPLLYTIGSLFAGALDSARLQAELEAQNRALEARVQERTKDLVDAMVEAREARHAAEEANEAKSRFLANVSHELRTPLTSVVGFAKLNRKRLDDVVFPVVPREDPKVDRAIRQVGDTLGIIVAEGERLTTLINDLLDLAKIESGRFEFHMAPLLLEDVVDRAIASTSSLFEVAGLPLRTEVDPGLPAVTGDMDRLVQVVINLLSNAVKFTSAGGVDVRVQRQGDSLRVAVSDTGKGIPATDHERIFEPFRQASDTVPDGPKGTGLGLPISRQIVQAHGGAMGVESAPGEGSTFWFTVPGGGHIPENGAPVGG